MTSVTSLDLQIKYAAFHTSGIWGPKPIQDDQGFGALPLNTGALFKAGKIDNIMFELLVSFYASKTYP